MAYQIIVTPRLVNKVHEILSYLEKGWSDKVAEEFLFKIDRRTYVLTKQPEVGAPSTKIKDVRGLLITRHNRLYYKIKKDKVILLNIYGTRMNSKKNPY